MSHGSSTHESNFIQVCCQVTDQKHHFTESHQSDVEKLDVMQFFDQNHADEHVEIEEER